MWPEGQEEELFDDLPETFLLCALHQAKIICERWKFWSGTIPADVSIRLHRLESMLSMNEGIKSMVENDQLAVIPLEQMSKINSSEAFLAEIQTYPTIERCFIEPKQTIILQGPDIRRIEEKRRVHFWSCCH